MVSLAFLKKCSAPTDAAKKALTSDIHSPSPKVAKKTVNLIHDESMFQTNKDQPTLWEDKVIRPKPQR